jgi:hypothetical protein
MYSSYQQYTNTYLVESHNFRDNNKLRDELNEYIHFNENEYIFLLNFISENNEFIYDEYYKCWKITVELLQEKLYNEKINVLHKNIKNISICKSIIYNENAICNYKIYSHRYIWCDDKSNFKLLKNIHTKHYVYNGEICDEKNIPIGISFSK